MLSCTERLEKQSIAEKGPFSSTTTRRQERRPLPSYNEPLYHMNRDEVLEMLRAHRERWPRGSA